MHWPQPPSGPRTVPDPVPGVAQPPCKRRTWSGRHRQPRTAETPPALEASRDRGRRERRGRICAWTGARAREPKTGAGSARLRLGRVHTEKWRHIKLGKRRIQKDDGWECQTASRLPAVCPRGGESKRALVTSSPEKVADSSTGAAPS